MICSINSKVRNLVHGSLSTVDTHLGWPSHLPITFLGYFSMNCSKNKDILSLTLAMF